MKDLTLITQLLVSLKYHFLVLSVSALVPALMVNSSMRLALPCRCRTMFVSSLQEIGSHIIGKLAYVRMRA